MNYIWEAVEEGKQVCFKQADVFSPYYETASIVEEEKNGKITVEYNSLFRYESIFAPLLSEDEAAEEWKEKMFDIITHVLVEQEKKSAITRKEGLICGVMHQIEDGIYGEENQKRYLKLSPAKRHKLAGYMVEQLKSGASVSMFAKALMGLWGTGVVYKNTVNPKVLLVYAGEKKSEKLDNIRKLVEDIFLPLDYEMRIFWETHFGIWGKQETMKYKQIEIF